MVGKSRINPIIHRKEQLKESGAISAACPPIEWQRKLFAGEFY